MSSKAALLTLKEIYDTTLSVFPEASVEAVVNEDNSCSIRFTIVENGDPLEIRGPVITGEFVSQLKGILRRLQLDAISQSQNGNYTLEPGRFSLEPLFSMREYSQFQCFFYQKEGRSIPACLVEHLEKQNQGDTLQRLGLSPEQLDEGSVEDVFGYFQQAIEEIAKTEAGAKKHLLSQLENEYPDIWARIISNATEQRRAQYANHPNGFQNQVKLLQKRIIGQLAAVQAVASILASQQNKEETCAFLFVGPSGVGKTELAKAVAATKAERLVFVSMNQYSSREAASSLFGSAAGLVGSTDRPYLAKKLHAFGPKKVPSTDKSVEEYEVENVVLLFDELEKAHSDVKQSLLTLFDESFCEIKYSPEGSRKNVIEKYRLKNSFLIGTSNLFQEVIVQGFQSGLDGEAIAELFKKGNQQIPTQSTFSPEFLNRMTIIPFGPIQRGAEYQKLIRLKLLPFLNNLKSDFSLKDFIIEEEVAVVECLEERFYGDGTDIRKIERELQKIPTLLHEKEQVWGGFENLRLILKAVDGQLLISAYFYNEGLELFIPLEQGHGVALFA